MADDYVGYENSLTSPAIGAADIIPSDSVALPKTTRAIYPVRALLVLATGTTATGLVALR